MNHAIAIATRELKDRSRLFVVAAAFACMPFLAALLPTAREHRPDVIAILAAVLSASLAIGSAMLLGATVIGRDLSERRLSFYFSRPISPGALWAGKAGAALVTSLVCLLIVALPALLTVGSSWRGGDAAALTTVGITAVVTVVSFFVAHAIATVIRSRSVLVAADLALAAGAVAAIYLIVTRVAFAGAIQHAAILLALIAGALVLTMALAPVWQLANGRTDVRRNHAAFTRAFWPVVAAIVILAAAYAFWLTTPDIDDLEEVHVAEALPNGDWSIVSGHVRNRGEYSASFIVNRRTGDAHLLPSPAWWGVDGSRDGRRVAWLQPVRAFRNHEFVLQVRDLDAGETRATPITATGYAELVLSDDGSRVAIAANRLLTVYDVASGRMLGSTKIAGMRHMYFATPDLVRVYKYDRGQAGSIHELDVRTRTYRETGATPAMRAPFLTTSADGSRMLASDVTVIDGRTGATVLTLPAWNAAEQRSRMLPDGGVARTGRVGHTARLQVIGADGQVQHDIALPMDIALVAGEAQGGKLLVWGRSTKGERMGMVVDRARGTIDRPLTDGTGVWLKWSTDPRTTLLPSNAIGWNGKGRA